MVRGCWRQLSDGDIYLIAFKLQLESDRGEGVTVINRIEQLRQQLAQRILVLDGGMGTMIL